MCKKNTCKKNNYADGIAIGIETAGFWWAQCRGSVTWRLCRRLPSAYLRRGSVTWHAEICRRPPVLTVGIGLTALAAGHGRGRRAHRYADG